MAKGSGRKIGNKKRKPSFAKWKANYNAGRGLKHRRKARRTAHAQKTVRPVSALGGPDA